MFLLGLFTATIALLACFVTALVYKFWHILSSYQQLTEQQLLPFEGSDEIKLKLVMTNVCQLIPLIPHVLPPLCVVMYLSVFIIFCQFPVLKEPN